MSGRVLFEHRHRGNLWRFEVATFRGRTFAQWRKWYHAEAGWMPCRDGFTMPLEALGELTRALMEHHGIEPPEALRSGK